MITVSKALILIDREVRLLGIESVPLAECVGRLLRDDVVADTDLPPFDRSQMDGYAVIADDTQSAPVKLKVVGEASAGHGWHHELRSGEAVRIMTGAPLPSGATAVQKVELTSETDGIVTIEESIKPAANVVFKGSEIKAGDQVFAVGERVAEQMIASLAAFGFNRVSVSVRPSVGILATGSEIVPVEETPGIDQIRNSNAPMLSALSAKCGALPTDHRLADDNLERLTSRIAEALETSDVLIITGGVSVGKYDLTKPALSRLGAAIHFEKVSLKPGKPAVFATLDEKLIFGLPGNPVSAAVTFELFVRPALMRMQGASRPHLQTGYAVLGEPVKAAKERDTYLPATLLTDEVGRLVATPTRWQGSSDFIGYSRAEALIMVAAGKRHEAGDVSTVLFL